MPPMAPGRPAGQPIPNGCALTDSLGWSVQALLACLAFLLLVFKRFCEPAHRRRPWLIWFYDTSKQGLGAALVHFANVFLAGAFQGDPCTWYIVSFLLDSSVGLFILWAGIRLAQGVARVKGWEAIDFGHYGKPPSAYAWLAQCCLYALLCILAKLVITAVIQMRFWDRVRDLILAPITDPKVELALVVLVVPFFVNALMFWVTDNFLMRRHHSYAKDHCHGKDKKCTCDLSHQKSAGGKIVYKKLGVKSGPKAEDSGSEAQYSGDEELLGACESLDSAPVGRMC